MADLFSVEFAQIGFRQVELRHGRGVDPALELVAHQQLPDRLCDPRVMEPLDQLENGPINPFAKWAESDVPREPGAYSIWQDGSLIYVGMAGRGVQVAGIDEDGHPIPQKTKGLYGRLHTHANGKRSGDQFCVYICDRFVVTALTKEQLRKLSDGANTLLDELTKKYIHKHLWYRYAPTRSGKAATDLENAVKAGALSCGPPLLNPSKAQKSGTR